MEDKIKKYIPQIWGICDLLIIIWYVAWHLLHNQIPFYSDYIQSVKTINAFGDSTLILDVIVSIIVYLSLILSGMLLLKKSIAGAIFSYIQTPFRLFFVIPPSIFIILWFPKYIFDKPPVILGFLLVLISEALKLWTIISWHRSLSKTKAVS